MSFDGRLSFLRVFFDMGAEEFPAEIERMQVVSIWSGGEGMHTVTVVIINPLGEDWFVNYELEGRNDLMTGVIATQFPGLKMPAPGPYTIKILLNGVQVSEYCLLMYQLEKPKPEEAAPQPQPEFLELMERMARLGEEA